MPPAKTRSRPRVQKRLARCRHAEPARLGPAVVAYDGHVGSAEAERQRSPTVHSSKTFGFRRAVGFGRVWLARSASASSARLARVQVHCGCARRRSVGFSVARTKAVPAGHVRGAVAPSPGALSQAQSTESPAAVAISQTAVAIQSHACVFDSRNAET